MNKKRYVIASNRAWNLSLIDSLSQKTDHQFYFISKKEDLTIENLNKINPRYIFFPHWSYIIRKEIFLTFECVVFHMTDLPYGRGGSPLQNLIINGHKETMMSALRCVQELDAGPIYLKRELSLLGSASEIFLRASEVVEHMILEIIKSEPRPYAQEGQPTFFKRRKPSESNLSSSKVNDVDDIFDFIRMLDAEGYPKAYIDLHNFRLEFSRVHKEPNKIVGTFELTNLELTDTE